MSQQDDHTLSCRDACGAKLLDQAAATHAGWQYLEASKTWRCPSCMQALARVNAPKPVN